MFQTKRLTTLVVPFLLAGAMARAQVVSGPPVNLTPTTSTAEYGPSISPDGTKLIFSSPQGQFTNPATSNNVVIANLDGSNRANIGFKHPSGSINVNEEWGILSPDGTKIAFHAATGPSNKLRLWVMDLATQATAQLTVAGVNTYDDQFPSWSPDGTKLIFVSSRNAGTNVTSQPFILNIGSQASPVPESEANPALLVGTFASTGTVKIRAFHPRFTADGNGLLLDMAQDNKAYADLFLTDLSGNVIKTLAALGKVAQEPIQAVPGGRVFFISQVSADGKYHVYSVDPNADDPSSTLRQVTASDNENETDVYVAGGKLVVMRNDMSGGYGASPNPVGEIGVANRDILMFNLTDAAGDGSLNGVLTGSGGLPVSGATVKVYNGATEVQSLTTDASGAYSATLPAGGYTLGFIMPTESVVSSWRGAIVPPGGSVVKNAWATPATAPIPLGVIATIKYNGGTPSVDLMWQPGAPPAGRYAESFKLFRGPSVEGPWTLLTPTPQPASTFNRFIDNAPGDIYNAFYRVTQLSSDGFDPIESAPSEVTQAANNLLFNASFEKVHTDPDDPRSALAEPMGWYMGNVGTAATGSQNTLSTDTYTSLAAGVTGGTPVTVADGLRAAIITSGVTRGDGRGHIQPQLMNWVPASPGQSYVEGGLVRFYNTPAAPAKVNLIRLGRSYYEPETFVNGVYPAAFAVLSTYQGQSTAFESTLLRGDPASLVDLDWAWLHNTSGLKPYETMLWTRPSPMWDAGSAEAGGRVLFDEVRFQVKLVGATGQIMGRVVDANGVPVQGATVAASTGQSAQTMQGPTNLLRDNVETYRQGTSIRNDFEGFAGVFVLRDVPTGPVTLTITYPGATTRTLTVENVGGVRLPEDVKLDQALPLRLAGTVFLPDGTPAANSKVTAATGTPSIGNEVVASARTDAKGRYLITPLPRATKEFSEELESLFLSATKGGYTGALTFGVPDAAGQYTGYDLKLPFTGTFNYNLTLGQAVPVLQVARTTTPPTIDGQVDPTEWAATGSLAGFFVHAQGVTPSGQSTTAYAMWDASNLYLAVVAAEPNVAGMKTTVLNSKDDMAVFGDDTIEIFLDPTYSAALGSGHETWQIGMNAASGSYTDGLQLVAPQWQPLFNRFTTPYDITGLQIAKNVDAAGGKWSVELKVPFAGLSVAADPGGFPSYPGMQVSAPALGTEWGGLFGRWISQISEYSGSAETFPGRGFIWANHYNTLRFVNEVISLIKGDMNKDGLVNIADAGIAAGIAGGLSDVGDLLPRGDVADGDGSITQRDAIRILRSVTGVDSTPL